MVRNALITVLVAAFVAVEAPSAEPAATSPGGDVVAPARVADHLEIVRIVDAIDAAVDAKDWSSARGYFGDAVRVDFTSLIGGEPATIPADALIGGWSSNLTAEKSSFHLRGNHRLTFDGPDTVRVASQGYAWNRMERGATPENGGDPLWEVWGVYEHGLVRTDAGWRVDAMRFTVLAERGNAFVRDTPGR